MIVMRQLMTEIDNKEVYNVTVSVVGKGWNVTKRDGRLRKPFKTKDEAISWVVMKGNCVVYVHKRDGSVDCRLTITDERA